MTNRMTTLARLSIGLLVCWLGSTAQAAVLYGTIGVGGTSSTLYRIDPVTGATTLIGGVGYAVNGLTWDASTGTLYGSVRRDAGLITIDTTTGAGTLVAGAFGSGAGGCDSIDGNVLLAANAAGSLYGWCDPIFDDLQSINKATGVATRVGESGVGTANHGLAFDTAGTLWMYNAGGAYYTIDTTTGAATFAGTQPGSLSAHHGDFNPDNDYYYGIDGIASGSLGLINVLDLSSGGALVTTVSTSLTGLHTLAFVKSAPVAVPEPGTLALIGLGLAGLALRRRTST